MPVGLRIAEREDGTDSAVSSAVDEGEVRGWRKRNKQLTDLAVDALTNACALDRRAGTYTLIWDKTHDHMVPAAPVDPVSG